MTDRDPHSDQRVPHALRARFDEIVALTDAVALQHLNDEYADLARRMAAVLAGKRPSPLTRGESRNWAAGILYAVGWVNFLSDRSQDPHMTTARLAELTGVGQSTMATTFRRIKAALRLVPLDPEWTRPSQLLDNPLPWLIIIDGMVVDLRLAPREVQEEAFREGLIPFVPADVVEFPDEGPDAEALSQAPFPPRELFDEAQRQVELMLAEHPDATIDDLNVVLEVTTGRYNQLPQPELGGLSPDAAYHLTTADWTSSGSAIRLDESLSLHELGAARTFQHVRLILAMLAEQGTVKATPKGNLPRSFVEEFRQRGHAIGGTEDSTLPRVPNEVDFAPLHIPRLLLELAGLAKRRKGTFSLTRAGERLRHDEQAGTLFATMVRTHFRRFNLGYLDGGDAAPGFQHSIGYALYQFGRRAAEWQQPGALVPFAVLPDVRVRLPVSPWFDASALILETRLLRPLVGLGLAECRERPRRAEELGKYLEYRKAPLFDRLFTFDVATS